MKISTRTSTKLPTLPVSACNSGHKMDTIGGKRLGRVRQVIEKMVSAVGIEPTTY